MSEASQSVPTGSALMNFSSRDTNIALNRLQRTCVGATQLERCEKNAEFSVRMRVAKIGNLKVGAIECANWRLACETRNGLIITFPLAGVLHCRRGNHEQIHEGAKHAAVNRPFEAVVNSTRRGNGLYLSLPVENLPARAECLTGRSYSPALLTRMVDQINATTPVALALANAMKAAMADAANLDRAGLWAFASNGYQELLTNLAIASLFPEIAKASELPVPDCGPAAMQRVRDYIRENAHLPISISSLANQFGVSMRALQVNFQRHLGLSPRNYLLDCRLEQVRRRLLRGEWAQSVTETAYACGFRDLSHFSAKYRYKFGELPSKTLHDARSHPL